MIPILTWVDYLLFQPKPAFEKKDPLKWLWGPFIYFVFILVRGRYFAEGASLVGVKRYPYFFMDAESYGYEFVFGFAIIFLVGCILFGYIIWLLDFIMGMIYTKFAQLMNRIRSKKKDNAD